MNIQSETRGILVVYDCFWRNISYHLSSQAVIKLTKKNSTMIQTARPNIKWFIFLLRIQRF